ncbi:MAG: sugar phosphate nucleotidyltransferase [Candidatus Kapabacteria bacterium]|nr:sugar phosphate nucleotidyltransferase [Candidatus Kapabacteria bacterium]
MNENLSVVILAAGKGKRMNNPNMAKVMAPLGDKPLITYVLEQVQKLNPKKIIVVVGHQKESVIEYIKFINIQNLFFAEQNDQLGTGHAVAQAAEYLMNDNGNVLILAGDVPLLKSESLTAFIEMHTKTSSVASDMTAIAANPFGYGRIVRDSSGNFIKIVEEKDTKPEEKLINEINSGIFIVKSKSLFNALNLVSNKNAQGEYYLTDIIEILRNENKKVSAFICAEFDELQGVNSVEDLKRCEDFLNRN